MVSLALRSHSLVLRVLDSGRPRKEGHVPVAAVLLEAVVEGVQRAVDGGGGGDGPAERVRHEVLVSHEAGQVAEAGAGCGDLKIIALTCKVVGYGQ